MTTMRGIDVSHWNHDAGFRPSMLPAGCRFVICKATEGTTFVDKACDKMIQQTKQYGMKFGFYHFAGGLSSATNEAEHFINSCRNYFGEGVPALDWEREEITPEWVNAFCEHVHARTKVWPWVYSTPSFFAKANGRLNENMGKWVARYGTNEITSLEGSPDSSLIESVSPVVAAWQFSSVGRVGSWRGDVDLDVFYGSESQWDAYAKGDRVFDENPPLTPDERPFPVIVENDAYKVTVERK